MIGGLTNHVWQSTLFAAAVGLGTVAFRKNRAQVRYWLWFSASAKFCVPFALLMGLGSQLQWAPAAKPVATTGVAFAVEQISQPFPDSLPLASPTPRSVDWVPMAIFSVWVCGFAAICAIRLRGWLQIRAAVRASSPVDRPDAVEIRAAPGLLEPGVVGVLRPILLLPEGIAERLTPAQLEAVLAHELCHVGRRDNLFAAIHMLVEAVFWFHPLVWWIGSRLVEERERACDEEVLRQGGEPQVYAEAILQVCRQYLESPLACVSGISGSDLKKRIHAILSGRVAGELNFARKAALAVAGAAVLAAPVVIGVMHVPAIRAQSTSEVTPKWEVVSIKPGCGEVGGDDGGGRKGGGGIPAPSPGRMSACVTVEDLIRGAYSMWDAAGFMADGRGRPSREVRSGSIPLGTGSTRKRRATSAGG